MPDELQTSEAPRLPMQFKVRAFFYQMRLVAYLSRSGQAKKPRLSKAISEDEDEEEQEINTSFSQRLTRFKKSPVKAGYYMRILSLI